MTIPDYWPVIGVCGYSGAGKTTLVEALIARLRRRGLAVAAVKHDAHGLSVDRRGKDSDRFFRAGATVLVHDGAQAVLRSPRGADSRLREDLLTLLRQNDIVIVEGHKLTPLPLRVWLRGEDRADPPEAAGVFDLTLNRDERRLVAVDALLEARMPLWLRSRPLRGGLLVGGRSTRMGRPKQLMRLGEATWAERAVEALTAHVCGVCLLGSGEVPSTLADLPRLADPPGCAGPIAGMLAAMRWDPEAAWIFLACDMPLMTAEAVAWLLARRRPGAWAVLPHQEGAPGAEPLGAWYDWRMADPLSRVDRPQAVVGLPQVSVVPLPSFLLGAWADCNGPRSARDVGAVEDGP